ncbi:asparagine synthetase B [Alteromonas macleodii]|uniref:asparagine synthase (glutamine-hydrolyzing) n=1 Tax=Alteromonas macleodii TaxID=28108 RepID=A0A126PX84_ALTMA|nr:asparagine synthase (glutamine-hydrolyzing) [Alteromonas macleodii]AMJ97582.1 asparagine synthetase B [Alteromonas macleodii]
MCGIAGIIKPLNELVTPAHVKAMTDAIEHRGRDGEGVWCEENVGIGHRRLSIIDLSQAGHQPMLCASHRYVLSYNGELYNYQALRTELEGLGFWFRSQSDSEVVLNALVAWGAEAVQRFNGMFAIALWDRQKKELFLARDRYGIKPLYFAHKANQLLFASEQKGITSVPSFQSDLDKSALLEYFTFQNLFTNSTLLSDIKMFPAGHYGYFIPHSDTITLTKYWDYNFRQPDHKLDYNEAKEELDRLFKQAVDRQLVSDVELGSYLSGGIDSGSISAIAAQSNPYMKTFTCGFDLNSASGLELSFDEREKAEFMSYFFKTEHYEMVLKAGDMERCLPKLAYHLEEPRVGQSYPNYYAAQLASKFVKVVLSGAGGDEVFGGYPWRYYRGVNSSNFEEFIDQYYLFWQRLVPNKQLKALFSPIWQDIEHVWTRDIFKNVFQHSAEHLESPEDYINHSLYFEAKTFLHGLLVVEDKLSMAHGLETRLPFLDNDLVDFAQQLPVEFKLNNLQNVIRINENDFGKKAQNYFQKTKDGKRILRDVMSNYIPDQISQAVKQGFSAPDASWFKGDSIEFVKRRLLTPDNPLYALLDYNTVKKLVTEHISGHCNRRLLIWSLLNISEWYTQHHVSN